MKKKQEDKEYLAAVKVVKDNVGCTAELLQEKLDIGYNHALALIEQMTGDGVLIAADEGQWRLAQPESEKTLEVKLEKEGEIK